MLPYNAQDLARSFRTVRANTIQIAEEIPEEKYSFQPAPDVRTVAQTLAHLAVATYWPKDFHAGRPTSVDFSTFRNAMQKIGEQEQALTTKPKLLEALRSFGEEFAVWLESQSDEFLAEHVQFPPQVQPPSKTRFEMLLGVKEHEMHHRAQLMVVERMLGIVPHLTRQMQERAAQYEAQMKAGSGARA